MSPREREIKLASGDLVEALGGFEKAAALIGTGKSQVHRCASVNDADSFLNLGDAAELERRSAVPFVTATLCKLAGGVFLKLPEDFGDDDGIALRSIETASRAGAICGRVREVLADGVVTAREAADLEALYDLLIAEAVQGRAQAQLIQGKERAQIVPIGEAQRG